MIRRMAVALALAVVVGVPAYAAAPQRTFVASYGNDANACTLTAPCRGFQAAINAVAAGGEVVALDSGGYGTMEIRKSVAVVVPPGIHAGLSPTVGIPLPGFPGQSTVVLIDIASTDVVSLRGLNINRQGSVTGGIDWISPAGGIVYIENTVVSGFPNEGLFMSALSQATVFVKDSVFRSNGYGIYVRRAAAASGLNRVIVDSVRIEASAISGFAQEGFVHGNLRNVALTGNAVAVYALASQSSGELYLDRCSLNDNTTGMRLDGTTATGQIIAFLNGTTMISNFQDYKKEGASAYMYSHGNNASTVAFDVTIAPN